MWKIEPPERIDYGCDFFGCDPGTTNIGIAVTSGEYINLFELTLERTKETAQRIFNIRYALQDIERFLGFSSLVSWCVIEGSAFNNPYRQVELAEMRTVVALWLNQMVNNESIHIVNPGTIRKAVFNNGRTKAHEFWENMEIGEDALAALSCLYYGVKQQESKKETEA